MSFPSPSPAPDHGGRLPAPANPSALPPGKADRWRFSARTWEGMTDDERTRWREWFDWATSRGGEFWHDSDTPLGGRAILRGARLDGARLVGVQLRNADLSSASLRAADLTSADLSGAALRNARLDNANLAHAVLVGADLARAHLSQADFTGADLSGALLHAVDFTGVHFRNARLFDARITEPVWWVEMPRATLSGQTRFPGNLPEHPIQDTQGLPPLLRRQIADAQYLRDMHRKATGLGRMVIWVWGVTCSYGQSLGRWSLCNLALLILFSLVFMLLPFNISVDSISNGVAVSAVRKPDFFHAVYFSVSTLMTLGLGDVVPATPVGRAVVSVLEVFGYIMLGGLLSIFATKLARLS